MLEVAAIPEAAQQAHWRPWHRVGAELWMCSSSIGWHGLVALRGVIDDASASGLAAELDELHAAGVGHLVLDLAQVTHLHGAAALVLARMAAVLSRSSGALMVRGMSGPIRACLAAQSPGARFAPASLPELVAVAG
jgi:anti-anti-sigma regulatory factor